jgi:hypothetical protein
MPKMRLLSDLQDLHAERIFRIQIAGRIGETPVASGRLNVSRAARINMSGSNPHLFRAPVPFPDVLQCAPAGARQKRFNGLRRGCTTLIAASPVATMVETILLASRSRQLPLIPVA